jgi:hypothetical protein
MDKLAMRSYLTFEHSRYDVFPRFESVDSFLILESACWVKQPPFHPGWEFRMQQEFGQIINEVSATRGLDTFYLGLFGSFKIKIRSVHSDKGMVKETMVFEPTGGGLMEVVLLTPKRKASLVAYYTNGYSFFDRKFKKTGNPRVGHGKIHLCSVYQALQFGPIILFAMTTEVVSNGIFGGRQFIWYKSLLKSNLMEDTFI